MRMKRVNRMYNYQLYHSDEIKQLEQELNVYKTVFNAIDHQEIVDHLTTVMSQNEQLTERIEKLKGDLKKMNEEQVKLNEQNKEYLVAYMESLDASFIALKEDVTRMMREMDFIKLKEVLDKVNAIVEQENKQETEVNVEKEMEILKAEIQDLKQQLIEKETTTVQQEFTPRESEFKRLKSILQLQNAIEQSNGPIVSNHTQQPPIPQSNRRMLGNFTHQQSPNRTMYQAYELNKNIITRIKPANQNLNDEKETIKIEGKSSKEELRLPKNEDKKILNKDTDLSTVPSTKKMEDVASTSNVKPENYEKPKEKTEQKNSIFSFFRKTEHVD